MRLTTLVVAGLLVIGTPAFAQIPADVLARAESGDPRAQFVVGYVYATGEDVPQDQAEAARWYRLAAEQGHANAQLNLGIRYATGEGVPEDDAEAVRWYRLAAEQALPEARVNLGYMYAIGEGVSEDHAEAARWYRLAAEQGNTDAQLYLGVIHANGRGVLENMERAYMWFSVAATGGSGEDRDNAADNRDLVSETFTPEQRARAQALATTCLNSNFTTCGEVAAGLLVGGSPATP
jgi:hypothetical protein